ncbi:unnamed protein product, partial [Closterium sp. NIES-54]
MSAWASPFPRYVSADYRVAPDKQDSWDVSDYHSWDSVPFLGWPVKDQKDCNACWAFALVASVEAAYGIATNGEAPQLSVESLFAAMGLTSEADKNDGSQNRIAPPFWIIRNSWGVEWGDRGHMRMDIQGGDGVCGINVLPGIYPIVKSEASTSWQPFIQVANGYGSQTCAYLDVCGSDLKNPCYVGTCINDGRGSYSCICPPNYVESTTIDSFPTCDPANTTASTLAVSGSNWWCSDVLPLEGLSLAQFTQNNAAIDCSRPLPRNVVLQLGKSLLIPCTAFFYTISSDTCWSISAQLGLTTNNLTALNPGLDCSEPIKAGRSLCVERNATFAFTVPKCLRYGVLTPQDTCERLLRQVAGGEGDPTGAAEVNAMRWAELYRNNPGLICSDVIPITASAVGSNTGVQSEGLGFESQCVHFGHPSARGCQRSTGDPRLILRKGYMLIVLG